MKTRIAPTAPFALYDINPYNGWDIEVPEKLVVRYQTTIALLDKLHRELAEIILPQAEAVDIKMNEYQACRGLPLRLLKEDV